MTVVLSGDLARVALEESSTAVAKAKVVNELKAAAFGPDDPIVVERLKVRARRGDEVYDVATVARADESIVWAPTVGNQIAAREREQKRVAAQERQRAREEARRSRTEAPGTSLQDLAAALRPVGVDFVQIRAAHLELFVTSREWHELPQPLQEAVAAKLASIAHSYYRDLRVVIKTPDGRVVAEEGLFTREMAVK